MKIMWLKAQQQTFGHGKIGRRSHDEIKRIHQRSFLSCPEEILLFCRPRFLILAPLLLLLLLLFFPCMQSIYQRARKIIIRTSIQITHSLSHFSRRSPYLILCLTNSLCLSSCVCLCSSSPTDSRYISRCVFL